MNAQLPRMSEIFSIKAMADRHPVLLNEARLKWALRNRTSNGLSAIGAVFESRGGELLIVEPLFLQWFLGLCGRHSPRSPRRKRRQAKT